MINRLDHLIVSVKDIAIAEDNFTKFFGSEPVWRGEHSELGTINAIYNFSNTYFEILAAKGEGIGATLVKQSIEEKGEGLTGIVLGTDNIQDCENQILNKDFKPSTISNGEGMDFDNGEVRRWKSLFLPSDLTRGLFAFLIQHTEGNLPLPNKFSDTSVNKLDHVVINTNDPDGFIDVYQDTYGIRLALDQTVEKWDGRMLFFRLNKTTIEVIAKKDENKIEDKLWGLAWDVEDIKKTHSRRRKSYLN